MEGEDEAETMCGGMGSGGEYPQNIQHGNLSLEEQHR